MTVPTARPPCPRGASATATREARPKKAPCGRPETKRASTRVGRLGAIAAATLPRAKTSMSATSTARRGARAAPSAMSGEPTTTPSA